MIDFINRSVISHELAVKVPCSNLVSQLRHKRSLVPPSAHIWNALPDSALALEKQAYFKKEVHQLTWCQPIRAVLDEQLWVMLAFVLTFKTNKQRKDKKLTCTYYFILFFFRPWEHTTIYMGRRYQEKERGREDRTDVKIMRWADLFSTIQQKIALSFWCCIP